jgi:hypothetical protein
MAATLIGRPYTWRQFASGESSPQSLCLTEAEPSSGGFHDFLTRTVRRIGKCWGKRVCTRHMENTGAPIHAKLAQAFNRAARRNGSVKLSSGLSMRRGGVSDQPRPAERVDRIALVARRLMEDAERGAARHDADMAEFARRTLTGHRERDRYFDPMVFSNPAWDILLAMYVASAEGRVQNVLDCCAAAPVAQRVTLRWLAYLKQEEMVIETPDPAQPRRTVMCLSDQARATINAYLASLADLGLGSEIVAPRP